MMLLARDLTKPLVSPTDWPKKFDYVLCCGSFTPGHLPASALKHLALALSDKGYLAVSTRNSYLDGNEFSKTVDALIKEGILQYTARFKDKPYLKEENASYWIFELMR